MYDNIFLLYKNKANYFFTIQKQQVNAQVNALAEREEK